MKNLITFALFEAIKPEAKLTTIKRKLMDMFIDKYSTHPTSQNNKDTFSKFVPQIGDVINSYLKTQKNDELYTYSTRKLKNDIFPEIDEKVISKMKNNDQFKKLFLDK